MYIQGLRINNYRGLDVNIETINKVSMLIGQNDSGKTNICQAILKVLDYKKRRIPFSLSDSTNSNKQDIIIEICLNAEGLNDEQLGIVGSFITIKNDQKYIIAKLVSKYNSETDEYEDSLGYGDPSGDFFEQKNGVQTDLDKVLSIVYISPVYDLQESESNFFSYVEKENKKKSVNFSENISKSINNLNQTIQADLIVKSMQNEINNNEGFSELFEGYNFIINPKIKINNLYKSLDVMPKKDDIIYEHIGDAKNKLLSTILKSKIYDSDKQMIYIVEEPENHLYVLLQKMYIKSLLELDPKQIIFTTHSPFTIDFEKINQIIKISDCRNIYSFNDINSGDFKKYGYLINVQIAEMLFYDEVLLVEGSSEKYFYSYLMSSDSEFLNRINSKKIGICEIDGIAFRTTKSLLEKLGIAVFIKTDNDIFLTPSRDKKRYAGIIRCLDILSDEENNLFYEATGLKRDDFFFDVSNENNSIVEEKMDIICDFFYKKRILFSKHTNGFEGDFIDFLRLNENNIDEEVINYLKKAKLKNLHFFIQDHKLNISLNDKTKKSILVSFIYE